MSEQSSDSSDQETSQLEHNSPMSRSLTVSNEKVLKVTLVMDQRKFIEVQLFKQMRITNIRGNNVTDTY